MNSWTPVGSFPLGRLIARLLHSPLKHVDEVSNRAHRIIFLIRGDMNVHVLDT